MVSQARYYEADPEGKGRGPGEYFFRGARMGYSKVGGPAGPIQRPILTGPKWKSLFTNARIKLNIIPKIKDDYYKIMSEAVKEINADEQVKRAILQHYVVSLKKYKSWQSYDIAVRYPAMFVQWLSERENKKITMKDMERPAPGAKVRYGITSSDGISFAIAVSDSEFSRAQVRSSLMGFGKFLDIERYVMSNPFTGLKVEMPKSPGAVELYNELELNEFFNSILFGSKPYHTLFSRLILQTGLRPVQAYYMTCGDIEDKPVTDALDRTFYTIAALKIYDREKKKIGEEVAKKFPPTFVYISAGLRDDLLKWCHENSFTGRGYIFKDFAVLGSYEEFIRRRRQALKSKGLLKSEKDYILYGLRHTWSAAIYAIGGLKTLTAMGGWTNDKVALDTYAKDMDEKKALKTIKDWEIYIIPEHKSRIERIQKEFEEERVSGAPTVSTQEWESTKKLIEDLQKQVASLAKAQRR